MDSITRKIFPENTSFPQRSLRKTFTERSVQVDFVVLLLAWIVAIVIIDPRGNFPLNDDWTYATAVKRMLEQGGYYPLGWESAIMVSQVIWGALFCLPFGFSFDALRVSMLVMAFIGVFTTYLSIRLLNAPRLLALAAAFALAFNPLYLALSHTFMTDVFFSAVTLIAMLFLSRYLLGGAWSDLFIGCFFAFAAILCRQVGLCIPLAFGITMLLSRRFNLKSLAVAVLPTLLGALCFFGFRYYLMISGKTLPLDFQENTLIDELKHPNITLLATFMTYFLVATLYLGMFLLPVTLFWLLFEKGEYRRIKLLLFSVITLAFAAILISRGTLMPLGLNVLSVTGIGPQALRDTGFLAMPHVQGIRIPIWVALTLCSVIGGAALMTFALLQADRLLANFPKIVRDGGDAVALLFFLTAAIYFVPLGLTGFYDRYLIPLIALVLVPACTRVREGTRSKFIFPVLSLPLIAGMTLFSVAITHDYMAWNRARWQALDDLTQQGVAPAVIDGGFEFNGLHTYNHDKPTSEVFKSLRIPVKARRFLKSWWWVRDDEYVIAFGAIDGYSAVRAYPYERWLPAEKASIYVLKRKEPAPENPEKKAEKPEK